jgi:hypothetical protein
VAAVAYDVGTAFLQIVPSFRHIEGDLQDGVRKIAREIEKSVADALPNGVAQGAKDAEKNASVAGKRSGAAFGGSLGKELQTAMKAAQEKLPELNTRIDPTQLDRDIDRVRQEIAELSDAHLNLRVDDAFVISRLRKLREQLRELQIAGRDSIDIGFNTKAAADILDTIDELERTGRRRGFEAGGAYSDAFTKRVVGAFQGLPQLELEPDIDLDHPLAQMRELRERLGRLQNQRIGVEFDANDALDTLRDIEAQFRRIAASAQSPQIRKDADRAAAELAKFYADIRTEAQRAADQQTAATVKRALDDARKQAAIRVLSREKQAQEDLKAAEALSKQAEQLAVQAFQRQLAERSKASQAAARQAQADADSASRAAEAAFAKTFSGRIPKMMREALQAFPQNLTINADASPAEREIFELTERMRSLGDAEIGIDLDAGAAHAELAAIRSQLQVLARTSPNIEIRTNALGALAEIDAVQSGAKSSQRELLGLAEGANFAQSRLTLMINAGAAMGPILVPAAATAAAAIGFIGTAAGSVAAGIGVFALGISGVGDAVKALNTQQQDAGKSAKTLSGQQNALANAADSVKMAEMGIADARASAGEAAVNSARRIEDAERSVTRARKEARQAAEDAAEALTDAQRNLTEAEGEALDVRKDLNKAIQDAKRDMQDLNLAIEQNALDQREATTAIMEEREKLDKLLSNPRATEIEKRNAQEAYDARVLQLKELRQEGKRMAEDQAKYAKQGVEANDKVIAVRERIADADKRVADQQRAVAKAQERVAEVQVESAERVAAAERSVQDARRAQQAQQRNSARQIANAQQALVRAQRSQAQAVVAQTATAGAAVDKLKESMDNLSPAGQRFAKFIFGLKDDVRSLRFAAQEGLLPGLQQGLEELLPYLPGLNEFVREIGESLGNMFIQLVRSLGNPTWQRFFGFFRENAVPTMELLFQAGTNVAEGFAELFLALTPFNGEIGKGLLDLTEGFAKWATELTSTTGYQEFLDYVREVGPEVVDLLLQMGEFAGRLVVALAPAGAVLVDVFGGLFEFLNFINPTILAVMATAFVVLGAAIVAMGLAVKGLKGLRSMHTELSIARTTVVDAYTRSTNSARDAVNRFGQTRVGGPVVSGFERARGAVDRFGTAVSAARTPTQQMERDMERMNDRLHGGSGRGGLIDGLGRAGAALAVMQTAGFVLPDAGPQAANMNKLTKELQTFAESGKVGSEAARVLGADLNLLANDFKTIDTGRATSVGNAFAGAMESISGLGGAIDTSLQNAKARLSTMDQALTDLVNNGNADAAAAIFKKLADEGARQGISVEELNKAMPGYNNALGVAADNAAKAADKTGTMVVEMDAATAAATRNKTIQDALNNTMTLGASARAQLGTTYDQNAARISALSTLVDQFNTVEGTAAGRAEALRQVIKLQTDGFINANEAEESYKANLDSLKTTVDAGAQALQGHKDKLDINTSAGRANRDALEQVASSIREAYLQDIASGVPMDEATAKHQARIKELKEESRRLLGAASDTGKLIDQYGNVPDDVKTIYKTDGFTTVYNELAQLKFIQESLAKGWSLSQAKQEWSKLRTAGMTPGPTMGPPKKAAGGRIVGPGTGTSDDVLMYGSNGEWVHRAKAVDYYGDEFMHAINTMSVPKEWLPGFATGGKISAGVIPAYAGGGKVMPWDAKVNVNKTKIPDLDDILAAAEGGGGGGSGDLGGEVGSRGWRWQMKVLRAAFPGLALYSGYRHSYTASGSLSWHGRDGGRAVDVPPKQAVFDWIHNKYGKGTKELIWGGDPNRNIQRGKHHRFDETLLRQHGPYKGKPGPSPHVHWAYDEGGWLPPGLTSVMNATGKPEAVFTSEQFRDIRELVQGRSGSSLGQQVYNFDFANSTLDADRLRSIQARQDALSRVGRSNF